MNREQFIKIQTEKDHNKFGLKYDRLKKGLTVDAIEKAFFMLLDYVRENGFYTTKENWMANLIEKVRQLPNAEEGILPEIDGYEIRLSEINESNVDRIERITFYNEFGFIAKYVEILFEFGDIEYQLLWENEVNNYYECYNDGADWMWDHDLWEKQDGFKDWLLNYKKVVENNKDAYQDEYDYIIETIESVLDDIED